MPCKQLTMEEFNNPPEGGWGNGFLSKEECSGCSGGIPSCPPEGEPGLCYVQTQGPPISGDDNFPVLFACGIAYEECCPQPSNDSLGGQFYQGSECKVVPNPNYCEEIGSGGSSGMWETSGLPADYYMWCYGCDGGAPGEGGGTICVDTAPPFARICHTCCEVNGQIRPCGWQPQP